MFSGIIEKKAEILNINEGTITVKNMFAEKLEVGQSIAHDGACMTITKFDDKKYSFFAMEESFNKTNFGEKNLGDVFNVERSLKFEGKVDGHFVTGHIDTTGIVEKLDKKPDGSLIINVSFDIKYKNNIIEKGSVSINGVSLTIVDLFPHLTKQGDRGGFSVSLIPLTQEITNLGNLKVGNRLNLEFDMIGKYIVNYMDKINS